MGYKKTKSLKTTQQDANEVFEFQTFSTFQANKTFQRDSRQNLSNISNQQLKNSFFHETISKQLQEDFQRKIDDELHNRSSMNIKKQNQLLIKQIKKDEQGQYEHNQKLRTNLWLWKNYIFQAGKIRKNKQKQFAKNNVLTQDEKQKRILKETMSHMEYMLDDTAQKIEEKKNRLQQLSVEIKSYYEQSHKLYIFFMEIKKKLSIVQRQEIEFQLEQKALQRQRKTMLQDKRGGEKTQKSQFEYLNLNLNDDAVKQVIQKKAKLNLQLDLSYQVQQRKKLNQAKKQFQEKKLSAKSQLTQVEKKIDQIKKKIHLKQKDEDRIQDEKERLQAERRHFLKQLLKQPQNRLDGVIWTLKKLIECGEPRPKLADLPDHLDQEGRNFIQRQYDQLKKQFATSDQRLLKKRKVKKKQKTSEGPIMNRLRVKSLADIQNSNSCQIRTERNNSVHAQRKQVKKKINNNFMMFDQGFMANRKKSNSQLFMNQNKKFLVSASNYQSENNSVDEDDRQSKTSFTKITNHRQVKRIYTETQTYLKDWVNTEGWKSKTPRSTTNKKIDRSISQQYIKNQKMRIKQKYFKIGSVNTKYESIVKTLFGQNSLPQTSRSISKTPRV